VTRISCCVIDLGWSCTEDFRRHNHTWQCMSGQGPGRDHGWMAPKEPWLAYGANRIEQTVQFCWQQILLLTQVLGQLAVIIFMSNRQTIWLILLDYLKVSYIMVYVVFVHLCSSYTHQSHHGNWAVLLLNIFVFTLCMPKITRNLLHVSNNFLSFWGMDLDLWVAAVQKRDQTWG